MYSVAPSLRPSACNRSSSSRGELHRDRRAPVRLHRRAGMVGRQLQQLRRARQALPPVRQLPLQHLARQLLALPHRVVGVLHRQLRQRRLPPLAVRRVQRRQLAEEHPHAPPVADDVVHRRAAARAPRRPAAAAPHGRAGPRARSNGRRASSPARRLTAASRSASPSPDRSSTGRANPPKGAITCTGEPSTSREDGAQRLVAPDDLAQRALQRRLVQRARQAPAPRGCCRRRSPAPAGR